MNRKHLIFCIPDVRVHYCCCFVNVFARFSRVCVEVLLPILLLLLSSTLLLTAYYEKARGNSFQLQLYVVALCVRTLSALTV